MPTRIGKCANFGLCSKADSGEAISVPDGADFDCPECKKELRLAAAPGTGGFSLSPRVIAAAVLALLLLLGIWWWFGRQPKLPLDNQPDGISTPMHKAEIVLRLHGSNTIGAKLGPDLAQAYLRDRGATNVNYVPNNDEGGVVSGTLPGQTSSVGIEVQAKGSATAFTDLASGAADIGMASRKIKLAEKLKLESLGDLEAFGAEHIIGLDGVAIIVNASNTVSSLNRDQVRRIFCGELTNWRDVGGNAGDIDVFSRPTASSGTFDTFNNLVLLPSKLVSSAKIVEDSAQLSDAVSQDINGIGFIGLPFIRSAKAVAISDTGTRPLLPNAFTVGREDYLLKRRLYLYVPPKRSTSEAQNFVRFVASEAGQAIVDKNGFVSQTVRPVTSQAKPDGSTPLNLDFRFRTGSAQLDNKALEDLDRVVTYVSTSDKRQGLMLIGYTDSVGTQAFNIELSKSRAENVADELKRRGLNVAGVAGLGADNPVASNDTPEGKEQNRRVEIWTKR